MLRHTYKVSKVGIFPSGDFCLLLVHLKLYAGLLSEFLSYRRPSFRMQNLKLDGEKRLSDFYIFETLHQTTSANEPTLMQASLRVSGTGNAMVTSSDTDMFRLNSFQILVHLPFPVPRCKNFKH